MPTKNVVTNDKKKQLTPDERAIAEKYYLEFGVTEWSHKEDDNVLYKTTPSDDKENYDNFLHDIYMRLLATKDLYNDKNYDEDDNFIAYIYKDNKKEKYAVSFNKDEVVIMKESFERLSSPPEILISAHYEHPVFFQDSDADASVSNASIPAADVYKIPSEEDVLIHKPILGNTNNANLVSDASIDNEKPNLEDDFNPQDSTVEIHDASGELLGRIIDRGESLNPIVFASDKVAALETMRHAQLKGWSSVNLTGSDEFVQECMKYCVENKITPIITDDNQQKMLDSILKKQKIEKKGLRM